MAVDYSTTARFRQANTRAAYTAMVATLFAAAYFVYTIVLPWGTALAGALAGGAR